MIVFYVQLIMIKLFGVLDVSRYNDITFMIYAVKKAGV